LFPKIKIMDPYYSSETQKITSELINMFLRFVFVFILFFVNFLALSISLNCNKDKSMGYKIFVGIYAFLFGFIYLFVNYYSYRVMTLGDVCQINQEQLFPL
jgi:lipopolysaccharide export LptBFGC system permease protein LptF